MRPGGTVVTCGATSGDQPGAELTRVFVPASRIQGTPLGSRADVARLLRVVEHAALHPPLDAVYAAADARAAFGRVIAGDVFGKVALTFA